MGTEQAILRAAVIEAVGMLGGADDTLEERVQRARSLLVRALEATNELPAEERARLDADPGVQEVLARVAAGTNGPYYVSGPNGLPTDEIYVPLPGERPLSEDDLRSLTFPPGAG
jgi:hypothetical protein